MKFEYWFLIVFALAIGNLAWRYFRSGSLAGAMLGGKITREVGQVALTSGVVSRVLKVYTLESSEVGAVVALSLVSKAAFGASMTPIKLTKSQALELLQLLQQAVH